MWWVVAIAALAGVLAGGYGGYRWGAAVERKARGVVNAVKG